jgi:YegS/Rv2252/BmrU family lipid kinase
LRSLVVVNPAACRGSRRDLPARVAAGLEGRRIPFEMHQTRAPGHAETLVRSLGDGFDTILVVGGDGTLHEALQALDLERHRVGIVPGGTGNDFAFMNGWPGDIDACLDRVAAGKEQRLDLGLWSGRRFHNNLGLGFEGRVNFESHRIRRLRGPAVYVAAVARSLAQRDTSAVRLDWDKDSWEGPLFWASVCIGRRVGGAFRLAPEARNDDGLFDVCFAADVGLLRLLALLPRTFRGGHVRNRHVRLERSQRLRIEAPRGIPVHVDGEFVALDVRTLDLQCLPRALRSF